MNHSEGKLMDNVIGIKAMQGQSILALVLLATG